MRTELSKPHSEVRGPDCLKALQTVRDWVRFFVSEMCRVDVFFGHGSAHVLDEAVYLVQSALHLPIEDISPFLEARVLDHEHERLHSFLLARTVERKPASYITGQSWLQGQAFLVDPRVIIPRSFIAELLADQLAPWVDNPDQELAILDLCTGSACLAILAAHAFPNAQVDAVDLSTDALAVARANIDMHQLESRVHAIESDLFTALNGKQYDIVLSNPPYVNEGAMQTLPAEYLHEPHMALAGGTNGMAVIDRILADAPKHLKTTGFLILELGHEKEHFQAAHPELEPTWLQTSAGDEHVFLLNKTDF